MVELASKEALLYRRLPDEQVECYLCPHRCLIPSGKQGLCRVRENRNGTLYSLNFGRIAGHYSDTMEKKPLFHFHPGSRTYSLATRGCNFRCAYCTNWEISQAGEALLPGPESTALSPDQIISLARAASCDSIAYTYVEPTIFYELMLDTARLARIHGLFNVIKSNGFITSEAADLLFPYLNAANVDLKSFRQDTYRSFGGELEPVLETLERIRDHGIWLEITTVIIPGVNDSETELTQMAEYIVKTLGQDTPWHLARFFPAYHMEQVPPTPMPTLHRAKEIGKQTGLRFVYFGNLQIRGAQDTHCPHCGKTVVTRKGFDLLSVDLVQGSCPDCLAPISGIGWNR